jgi:hypothetical protein
VTNTKDALDHARGEAQSLLKKLEAASAKNDTAIRADLQAAATHAHELASSLTTVAHEQRADAKQHIDNAIKVLEEAAKHAKSVAAASGADLKKSAHAMTGRAKDAVENLSRAVASRRAMASAAK